MAKRIVLIAMAVNLLAYVAIGIRYPPVGAWAVATFWMVTVVMAAGWWMIALEYRPPRALWLTISVGGLALIGLTMLAQRGTVSAGGQAAWLGIFIGGVLIMGWVARRHWHT